MFINVNLVLVLASAAKLTTFATCARWAIALLVFAKAAREATFATFAYKFNLVLIAELAAYVAIA